MVTEEQKAALKTLGLEEKDIKDKAKIEKERRKLLLRWHPDRLSTKSQAEKETAEKKIREINVAYGILTKGDDEDNDIQVECHYCEKPVDFSRTTPCQDKHFNFAWRVCFPCLDKVNKKLCFECNGKAEKWFGPLRRYYCIGCLENGCYRCGEQRGTEWGSLGNFEKVGDFFYCCKCLDRKGQPKELYYRRKAPEEEKDTRKKCCKCNKPISGKVHWLDEQHPICVSCATKKCIHCGKQGVPIRGSGWLCFKDGCFCCPEHYKEWAKSNSSSGEENDQLDIPQIINKVIQEIENELNESEIKNSELSNPSWEAQLILLSDKSQIAEFKSQILAEIAQLKTKKLGLSENREGRPITEGTGDGVENNELPNHTPPPSKEDKNQELPKNIQEIAQLPLPQALEKAEQEIEKLLKDNNISIQELDQAVFRDIFPEESNWMDYLKKLDTPAKVAEFTDKMRQAILKKKFANQQNPTPEDNKPKNGWILPVIISLLSLLALSTLILIVRKRKRRGF